jgi:hypothetical protein
MADNFHRALAQAVQAYSAAVGEAIVAFALVAPAVGLKTVVAAAKFAAAAIAKIFAVIITEFYQSEIGYLERSAAAVHTVNHSETVGISGNIKRGQFKHFKSFLPSVGSDEAHHRFCHPLTRAVVAPVSGVVRVGEEYALLRVPGGYSPRAEAVSSGNEGQRMGRPSAVVICESEHEIGGRIIPGGSFPQAVRKYISGV